MSKSVIDKINYIVALITEFATAHHITTQQAYRYLQQYKGLDFVDKFYDVEHTYSFENTVKDLTAYCQRMGGTLVLPRQAFRHPRDRGHDCRLP